MTGPLTGIKIVEFAGIGPGPHAAMIFADMGAEVIRLVRPGEGPNQIPGDVAMRGRTNVEVDLKSEDGFAAALALAEKADVLIEGFRPGVMERLGLGPEAFKESNPGLIYGRVTGWGQSGPLANKPGHDINYIAISGMLHATGTATDPVVPLNLYGDFGGGSMMLVTGVLAALVERSISGKGQTIDAAMVDGISLLSQMIWSFRSAGQWVERRASNLLDGGAHFYGLYRCADGEHVAVGAIEPQFYAELLQGLGLPAELAKTQRDPSTWSEMREEFEAIFASKTRNEWGHVFAETNACVTPVLNMTEALEHPHMQARKIFAEVDGSTKIAPAPRFDRTVSNGDSPDSIKASAEDVLQRWQAF